MLRNFDTYPSSVCKTAFRSRRIILLSIRYSGIITRRVGHSVRRSLLRVGGRIVKYCLLSRLEHRNYRNLAYSALASFRVGMSGSASFQRVRKSL